MTNKNNPISDVAQEIFRSVLADLDFQLEPAMVTGDHKNWDSMANVEILLACEQYWKIEFRAAEIDMVRTAGDLIDAVCRKVAKHA
jgi:acyl carrier protein